MLTKNGQEIDVGNTPKITALQQSLSKSSGRILNFFPDEFEHL